MLYVINNAKGHYTRRNSFPLTNLIFTGENILTLPKYTIRVLSLLLIFDIFFMMFVFTILSFFPDILTK